MKKIYLFATLILSLQVVFSQETKTISINKNPLQQIKTSFYFDKIIDWRTVKSSIGFCQTGGFSKRKDLVFESDFCNEIGTYFKKKVSIDLNSKPLYLIINNFWVSERTTAFAEKGLFCMSALICSKDSLGNYNQLYEYDNFIEETNLVDVTAGHINRITTTLDMLLKEFSSVPQSSYDI